MSEEELKPIIETLIYLAEEPLTLKAMVELLGEENEPSITKLVSQLIHQYDAPGHGIEVRELADGYKMATKPEYHDWVQRFIRQQKPPVRLSLPALETLAVIAYKQPVTLPEIQEIRGVNAAAVMKTLVEKKLVTAGGRKNVVGRPILYKTTKNFLLQFGLKNLGELPGLDEYQEIAQASLDGSLEVQQSERNQVKDSSDVEIQSIVKDLAKGLGESETVHSAVDGLEFGSDKEAGSSHQESDQAGPEK